MRRMTANERIRNPIRHILPTDPANAMTPILAAWSGFVHGRSASAADVTRGKDRADIASALGAQFVKRENSREIRTG